MTESKNAGRKLARSVAVGGKMYHPGDDVPDEVLAQIRSERAFVPLENPFDHPKVVADDGYDGMRKDDLMALCKERQLNHLGSKPVLVQRLRDYDAALD